MNKIVIFLTCLLAFCSTKLSALDICNEEALACRGKAEIAPAYVHVDFLLKGHTFHRMDLAAVKADLNYRVWSGLVLKPTFLYGQNKHADELATGGIGIGFCVPIECYKLSFTPVVGINFAYISTEFDFKQGDFKLRLHQRTRSRAPYVGLEACWTFIPAWRIVLSYQYAWSRTLTKLTPVGGNDRSKSEGSAYAGMIEHDINDHFSVNFGIAYNTSLSKEKHGIRGWGMKLGFAHWF